MLDNIDCNWEIKLVSIQPRLLWESWIGPILPKICTLTNLLETHWLCIGILLKTTEGQILPTTLLRGEKRMLPCGLRYKKSKISHNCDIVTFTNLCFWEFWIYCNHVFFYFFKITTNQTILLQNFVELNLGEKFWVTKHGRGVSQY